MTNERLSVPTIRATLEDMRKHGLRGGLPQEEAFFLLAELDHLAVALGAARQLLEDWMLAGSDFDMEAWATRVRDMLEDSNPFNRRAHEPKAEPVGGLRTVMRVNEAGDLVPVETEPEPKAGDAAVMNAFPGIPGYIPTDGWIVDRVEHSTTYWLRHPNGSYMTAPREYFSVNRGEKP